MLTYHPAHDPSHCIFRILCLLKDINKSLVSVDLIKLLDFYVLFPHALKSLSLPKGNLGVTNNFKTIKEPYENLPSPSHLMFQLSLIQDQVIKSLFAKGILNQDTKSSDYIALNKDKIIDNIAALIDDSAFRKEQWYQDLINIVAQIPLKGESGLKKRSGLMEYRYDVESKYDNV